MIAGSALLSLLCLWTACEHEQSLAPPLGPTLASIQANIFTPKCVNRACHPGGGAPMSLADGVARSNLVGITSAYGNLKRVQPLDANNSVLYLKVKGDPSVGGPNGRMPLGFGALSNEEIVAIQTWINNGAQND